MTTPTQAQIEAVFDYFSNRGVGITRIEAEAALTAAAEVEEGSHERADEMRRLFKGVANHTIERCAQVADEFKHHTECGKEIGRCIRALKDKSMSLTEREKQAIQRMENSIAATPPTQAQIDAAIVAYHRKREGDTEDDRMKAALAAAAEVDNSYEKFGIDPRNPNPDGSDYHLMNAIDDIKKATIERCAQEVEKLDGTVIGPYYRRAAAAIRALKDKP